MPRSRSLPVIQPNHADDRQLGGKRRKRYRRRGTGPNPFRARNAGTFTPDNHVPKTRGECVSGPRPCPHARCTMHLWFASGAEAGGRYIGDDTLIPEWLRDSPGPSCALDLADRGPHTSREIAGHIGLSTARAVELIVKRARERLRRRRIEIEDESEGAPSLLALAQERHAPGTIGIGTRGKVPDDLQARALRARQSRKAARDLDRQLVKQNVAGDERDQAGEEPVGVGHAEPYRRHV